MTSRLPAIFAALALGLYTVAYFLVPVVPIGDAEGHSVALTRLGWWLLVLDSPASIWQQWTQGYPASFVDRVPCMLGAIGWLALAYALGLPVARTDRFLKDSTPWSQRLLTLACGGVIASCCVAMNGLTFGPRSTFGAACWFIGTWLLLRFGLPKISVASETTPRSVPMQLPGSLDPSFEITSNRRMIGVSWLGSVWIAALVLAGACLPSYDMEVRENDLMAIKKSFLGNRFLFASESEAPQVPRGPMMPALLWMPILLPDPSPVLSDDQILSLQTAAQIGQVVQGAYAIAAGTLLGLLVWQSFGALAGAIIALAWLATPGMFELARLGGGAGEAALWMACAIAYLFRAGRQAPPAWNLLCVASGAIGNSLLLGYFLGIPLIVIFASRMARERTAGQEVRPADSRVHRALRRIVLLLFFVGLIALWPALEIAGNGGSRGFDGRAGEGSGIPWETNLPFGNATWGERSAQLLDAWSRIFLTGYAQGFLLVPLAVLGVVVGRDSKVRLASLVWIAWMATWWIATPQRDRDWVIAMPWLVVPAASGAAWLQGKELRWMLLGLGWVAWAWSVVALPIWPTADNRLLVPMRVLQGDEPAENAPERGRVGEGGQAGTEPPYTRWLNRHWREAFPGSDGSERLLLVGSADAYRFAMPVVISSRVQGGGWKTIVDQSLVEPEWERTSQRRFHAMGIRRIVFDWRGMRARDGLLGEAGELVQRDRIQQSVAAGVLRLVPWAFLSSDAECYEVLHDQWSE